MNVKMKKKVLSKVLIKVYASQTTKFKTVQKTYHMKLFEGLLTVIL